MHNRSIRIAMLIAFFLALPAFAADTPKPVRTGSEGMMFETVPGWGLLPDGKSALGSTHGGVVVDKEGNIYTSAAKGVVVFSPDGKVIRSFLGKDYSDIHDLKISEEGGKEYIYGARNNAAEGIKFDSKEGKIVLKLGYPKESGLTPSGGAFPFSPTAIVVAANGDIYLSNGYATNHIFKFDKTGKYLSHFGERGNGMKQFNTAHGMVLDTRYEPNRLLICDRNHTPKGRLVHYDLDGKFIGEVATDLGMPTSAAIHGEYVAVPDLLGKVWILDKSNKVVATLGESPTIKPGANFGIPQDKWVEGVFAGTHGAYWDKDGNLYVQDWNTAGRIMKLVRVKETK